MIRDDLDIIKIIKRQRRHSVALFGLMTSPQRKFAKMQDLEILSEYTTPDEDDNFTTRGSVAVTKDEEEPFDFLK